MIGTVPASAKITALEANPAVAVTIDTSPPAWPPNVLLFRGTATVTLVDGVFPEYVAGARKVTPAEEFPNWEAGVHALYDQMARIARARFCCRGGLAAIGRATMVLRAMWQRAGRRCVGEGQCREGGWSCESGAAYCGVANPAATGCGWKSSSR